MSNSQQDRNFPRLLKRDGENTHYELIFWKNRKIDGRLCRNHFQQFPIQFRRRLHYEVNMTCVALYAYAISTVGLQKRNAEEY